MAQTNQTMLAPLATLFALLLVCGCEKPPVKYVDAKQGFTLSYPGSWQREESSPLVLLTGDGSGTTMPSKVLVMRQAAPWGLGWTLSKENFDDIQTGVLHGLTNVEGARVETAVDATLGGKPARSTVISGHSTRFGSDVKMDVLFCVHDGAVYTIIGMAAPERFQHVRDDMASVAESFRILQK